MSWEIVSQLPSVIHLATRPSFVWGASQWRHPWLHLPQNMFNINHLNRSCCKPRESRVIVIFSLPYLDLHQLNFKNHFYKAYFGRATIHIFQSSFLTGRSSELIFTYLMIGFLITGSKIKFHINVCLSFAFLKNPHHTSWQKCVSVNGKD